MRSISICCVVWLFAINCLSQTNSITTKRKYISLDLTNSMMIAQGLGQHLTPIYNYSIDEKQTIGVGLDLWYKFLINGIHGIDRVFQTYSLVFNYRYQFSRKWSINVQPSTPLLWFYPMNYSIIHDGPKVFVTNQFWGWDSDSDGLLRKRIYGDVKLNFNRRKRPDKKLSWNYGAGVLFYSTSDLYKLYSQVSPKNVDQFRYLLELNVGLSYRF